MKRWLLFIYFFSLVVCNALSQNAANKHAAIQTYLQQNNIPQAASLLQQQLDYFTAIRNADSLTAYIKPAGLIWLHQYGEDKMEVGLNALIKKITALTSSANSLYKTYFNTGELYECINAAAKAYEAFGHARIHAVQMNATTLQTAEIFTKLGAAAGKLGEDDTSYTHFKKGLRILKPTDHELLYECFLGIGFIMWDAAKMDSTEYYFNNALQEIKQAKQTIYNKFFRTANAQNAISGLYNVQGKTSEAMRILQEALTNTYLFLANEQYDEVARRKAYDLRFRATDNLAGFYKSLGDYIKAHDLLSYSYEQKKLYLQPGAAGVFISQILIGQNYLALREYDKALQYLEEGLAGSLKNKTAPLYWQGDAYDGLALVHDKLKHIQLAKEYYEKADSIYNIASGGVYDYIYLDFLNNAALFYSENNYSNKALDITNRTYNYVVKEEGENSLLPFYHLLNLSEVNYNLGKYNEAFNYATKALGDVNHRIALGKSILDSVQMEVKKPKAIFVKAKASYALLKQKDATNLQPILNELNEALAILERRKTIIYDADNINLMMADQSDVLKFIQKITLELYSLTHNKNYLQQIAMLHESALYNRIRSRFDLDDSIRFAGVPEAVRKKERDIKSTIAYSLQTDKTSDSKMKNYFASLKSWQEYLVMLQKHYPQYYKMRFASIFKTFDEIQKDIPEQTTIIRYLYADDKLLAFVLDKKGMELFTLVNNNIEQQVKILTEQWDNEEKTSLALHSLYTQLWQPFAKNIVNKKLVIIPDGILYNISFEALTPKKISSFERLATNSLLAQYNISYRYSLFLLRNENASTLQHENFIAFAPGFTDDIKAEYTSAVKDPVMLDKTYLSLLPLQFTNKLIKKLQDMAGGDFFEENASTINNFRNKAGDHKVIHIGTHAESNNMQPQFSRLIFAKNPDNPNEENSLYLPEIYNCNMQSQLTVLTACESGKPGYQDGEGMVSMAHAFNYAGSRSILTALWKIDEQSSATITEFFYNNILKGLPKDEALRLAKLQYLKQSKGRLLAPQYWSGLIIMGDTSPVTIKRKTNHFLWIAIFSIAIVAAVLWLVFRKKYSANAAA